MTLCEYNRHTRCRGREQYMLLMTARLKASVVGWTVGSNCTRFFAVLLWKGKMGTFRELRGADGLTVGQDGGLRREARAHFAGGNAAKEKPSSRSTARLLAGRGSRWHHSRHYSKNWVFGK